MRLCFRYEAKFEALRQAFSAFGSLTYQTADEFSHENVSPPIYAALPSGVPEASPEPFVEVLVLSF